MHLDAIIHFHRAARLSYGSFLCHSHLKLCYCVLLNRGEWISEPERKRKFQSSYNSMVNTLVWWLNQPLWKQGWGLEVSMLLLIGSHVVPGNICTGDGLQHSQQLQKIWSYYDVSQKSTEIKSEGNISPVNTGIKSFGTWFHYRLSQKSFFWDWRYTSALWNKTMFQCSSHSPSHCPRHQSVLQQPWLVLVPSQYCMDGKEKNLEQEKRNFTKSGT